MEALPIELVYIVYRYLPIRDVKSFRLMNHRFAKIGTELLFTQVYPIFEEESIQHLQTISQHPVISRIVKELFCESSFLRDYKTKQGWLKRVGINRVDPQEARAKDPNTFEQRYEVQDLSEDGAEDIEQRYKNHFKRCLRGKGLQVRYSFDELS